MYAVRSIFNCVRYQRCLLYENINFVLGQPSFVISKSFFGAGTPFCRSFSILQISIDLNSVGLALFANYIYNEKIAKMFVWMAVRYVLQAFE